VSENENKTNTITNFSSANTSDNKIQDGYLPKDLYDECVSLLGKSFCDIYRK